jgi:hypothetical protein
MILGGGFETLRDKKATASFTDLDQGSEMIISWSNLTTFEACFIFKTTKVDLACPVKHTVE